jgi:hypothetical protein
MKTHPAKQKKPYQKPEIEQVHLLVEEAVLRICKNTSGSGPARLGCINPAGRPCNSPGT